MRNKSLFLLIACVCGTIAAIGVSQFMQANSTEGASVEVYIAAVDIDKGEEITAEKIRLEQWPQGKQPPGSTSAVADILNKYAKTAFYAGEAVMPVKLTESSYKVIPKGFSVVALRASDVDIAHVIQPGDRVNVIAYFNKSELIPRSMTKTVLMGVRVYALDGDTERRLGDDKPKTIRTIQLLIHKNDAEAWTYANELGKVRLAVGNDEDYGANTAEDGTNLAAIEFLKWLDDYHRLQEEARAAKAKPEPRQVNARSQAAPEKDPEDEGFVVVKMVEGRMVRYLLVPGKLPRIIEDTGPGGRTDSSEPTTGTGPVVGEEEPVTFDDDRDVDYSFLNGEDSPFFQSAGPEGAASGL